MEKAISICKVWWIVTSVGWKQGFIEIWSFHRLVTWCSLSIGESSGAMKGQVWMNGWGNICVEVLCRNWRLFRHIFIALFKVLYHWTSVPRFSLLGSQLRVHGYFSTEVAYLSLAVWAVCLAYLSLAVWAVCLAWPLSLRFLAPWFRSLSAAARRDVSLVSGPSPISSDFVFLR